MTRSPIRRMSAKQRARKRAWAKVTKQRIEDVGGWCEVGVGCICTDDATDGHHKLPRRFGNDSYANCLVVCRRCHEFIETHPAWAKEKGYILTDPSQLEKP